jgi:4-hydroxy-3-methylbut-2-enyl diphosphate reductase
MDIKFMGKDQNDQKDFSVVKDGDVVILPAFGATIQEMQMLDERGVQIVDTTCPWVSKVWNAVDSHIRSGQTSVIHGKYAHEETIATASFCADYIVVKDLPEAQYLIDYIVNGGNKEEFLEKFKNAISVGFDPDVHLEKVGLANQTTMYKRETKEIGRMLEKAILTKFGPAELGQRYNEFDTICDATQERQDAVTELVEKKGLDFVLVVGGFDSSNTAHLKEIPEKFGEFTKFRMFFMGALRPSADLTESFPLDFTGVEAFHINRPECITEENKVSHRLDNGEIVVHENFLKKGPMTIGVTSGASTPDK